jgi:hypothetical protein
MRQNNRPRRKKKRTGLSLAEVFAEDDRVQALREKALAKKKRANERRAAKEAAREQKGPKLNNAFQRRIWEVATGPTGHNHPIAVAWLRDDKMQSCHHLLGNFAIPRRRAGASPATSLAFASAALPPLV